MKRVAVIGSGISGLAAAWQLSAPGSDVRVTLFEAAGHFGGHTHTVDVTLEGSTHGVDTGFLVFNERTYPQLVALFGELGVERAAADMSFSVQLPQSGLEWSGSSLGSVFAQRRNLLRPRFWRMLAEIARFNRLATGLAERAEEVALTQPIGEFLAAHRFSSEFRDWYFLPIIGSIWSCPTEEMQRIPIATVIRFCHNHGLLQITGRPQWYTVQGGARRYVEKLLPRIADARLATPVRAVHRLGEGAGALVLSDAASEHFDEVVFACHSDQALALLAGGASPAERRVLGAIRCQRNRAVLHTDTAVLPRRRQAWAAWNYEHAAAPGREQAAVCLHYLLNRLQPLPFHQPVIVSLNPARKPRADAVLGEFDYRHPMFDLAAVDAQKRLPTIQGPRHSWFCGAWTGYGFHEDGLKSGLAVAQRLRERMGQPSGDTMPV